MRYPVRPCVSTAAQPLAIMIEPVTRRLVIVHDMDSAWENLETPDRHRVIDANIPGCVDRNAFDNIKRGQSQLAFGCVHLLAPECPENGRREGTEIFLFDQRIAKLLAVYRVIFAALGLYACWADRPRVVD